MKRFSDRREAGRRLATRLDRVRSENTVVLALPRGGVPVAHEVATSLGLPLDVLMVRKLGVPFQPEFAMGAIGECGVRVLDRLVMQRAGVTEAGLAAVESLERQELERRLRTLRGPHERRSLEGKVAVIVDDGVATGSTMMAACEVARILGAERVVVAVPVASVEAAAALATVADEVICLETPSPFGSVGAWYDDFAQTTDEEVIGLLATASSVDRPVPDPAVSGGSVDDSDSESDVRSDERAVVIAIAPRGGSGGAALGGTESPVVLSARIEGRLTVPPEVTGAVIFAHGSGSGRHSPRNRFVAACLNDLGIATLLLDLLTPDEELDRRNVFDVELLAERLVLATRWLRGQPELAGSTIGYFGASTGAGAALIAAADLVGDESGCEIGAVVSRGGRPDLATDRLSSVTAPTLLIVGGDDHVVVELNRRARSMMTCETALQVIPGATHLFEETGALEAVAGAAAAWFAAHLGSAATVDLADPVISGN